jgi:hypothetical protein
LFLDKVYAKLLSEIYGFKSSSKVESNSGGR